MLADQLSLLLWRDLVIFLLLSAVLGMLLGLLLLFKPQMVERLNRSANRWISTRHLNQWLDRSINIERWFFRHHRATGGAIVLGAVYILIYFGILFDKANMLQGLRGMLPDILLDSLLDALELGALIWCVVALIAGLVIWLRPSLLRDIEKEANQWLSLRRATKILDVQHSEVDHFVMHHAQRIGGLMLLSSIYLFIVLLRWLR
jgi:hypothetical protein